MINLKPLYILIIDDNPAIHEDFRKIFENLTQDKAMDELEAGLFGEATQPMPINKYILEFSFQGKEGVERVRQAMKEGRPYALAFVDIRMPPGIDGIKTILQIWKVDPYIQTVICTAYSDYTWADMVKSFGLTDRLLILKKPFDNDEVRQCAATLTQKYTLGQVVRQQVVTLQQIVKEQTHRLEESLLQLEHHATYDALTDLPNRSLLIDRLEQIIVVAKSEKFSFPVVFLDLNRFKHINDNFGHLIGNEFLKQFAIRLKQTIHTNDTVARFGGDEFVVILPKVRTEKQAIFILEKISQILTTPIQIDANRLVVTPNMGVSFYPKDGETAETLIRNADTAMFKAKELGHTVGLQFFNEEMNVQALEQLQLENSLRQALEGNNFLLHYQPIVDLKTGKVVGMEALLRWQHPTLGLIYPKKFIPVAEETGLIVPIGQWVLNTACEQNKRWQESGLAPVIMSVNFSGVQMKQAKAIQGIHEALTQSGLDAKYLELELTESIIMQNSRDVRIKMHQINDMGVKLVIDDFGTGYSSLSYLQQFPVSKIKIDRSFIRKIGPRKDESAIVLAIIGMGHALQMRVLAEGVETHGQMEFLRLRGCDEMQGFLYSRPVTADLASVILLTNKKEVSSSSS